MMPIWENCWALAVLPKLVASPNLGGEASVQLVAGCVQMNSGSDVAANLVQAAALMASAAEGGAQLILLPENFALMGEDAAQKQLFPEQHGAVVTRFLADQARQHRVWIIAGSLLAVTEQGALCNRSVVMSPEGEVIASYDKIHLFDATPGSECYRESDLVTAGEHPVVADIAGWRVGLSICFDVRFPALFQHYRQLGCDLFSMPAAFTYATGHDHWLPLLQARAIETQCYLLAAAQCGHHPSGRKTWGNSMILDPWGGVVARLGHGVGVIMHSLDRNRITAVRQQIPLGCSSGR
ncbi:MAG: carbon-nitrogen hydrolase family protein [Mariprofundales bacterium]|nr:carbon-nitrogen hydrolase family protein [Mariprofundales bacterium]